MPREILVMLPGMMCDAPLFAPQIAALEDRFVIIIPSFCAPASIEGLRSELTSNAILSWADETRVEWH